ncbi:MAG: hypothetical protein QG639_223 [Patescibacteria group bacterium]|nr:hypothetical protein [Patescibacteria group bacterium]
MITPPMTKTFRTIKLPKLREYRRHWKPGPRYSTANSRQGLNLRLR